MNSKIVLLFCTLLYVSCKTKSDITPRINGQEYFNNKTGSWIVYHVDSIVFSDFSVIVQKADTFSFQVKEIIADKFVDATGKENNRIERYSRLNDTMPWVISNIWSSQLNAENLQKVEENIRYVKLIFPVILNKTWSGNQMNTLIPWDYSYTEIKKPFSVNGHAFSNTLTVIQEASDENVIQQRFAKEIYAEGIGMVYKQLDTVEVQNKIKKGLYYRLSVMDWSK